jgi:hypothetical protein
MLTQMMNHQKALDPLLYTQMLVLKQLLSVAQVEKKAIF